MFVFFCRGRSNTRNGSFYFAMADLVLVTTHSVVADILLVTTRVVVVADLAIVTAHSVGVQI